ncbi:MAG: hypothetical protein ACE15B_01920 [Bryobacteraceae bacterium]
MLKLFLALAAAAAFAQDDPWAKVRELDRGSELRIYRTGRKRPVEARFEALSQNAVVVIVKTTNTAIPKSEIERIDARPASGAGVKAEVQKRVATPEEATLKRSRDSNLPPGSTSAGIKIKSKPGFVKVYPAQP